MKFPDLAFAGTSTIAVTCAALLGAGLTISQPAAAQGRYPERPISLIVSVAAGGAADTGARIAAEYLGRTLKNTIVVENRTGGNNRIGWLAVRNAKPDGYILLAGSSTMIVGPILEADTSLDMEKEFVPIGFTNRYDMVVVTSPSTGFTTLTALMDAMKKTPEKVSYAAIGEGTPTTLSGKYLAFLSGNPIQDVNYRGGAASIPDILAGRISYAFVSISSAESFLPSGKLLALAIATSQRNPQVPNVPTMAEAGLPEFMKVDWRPWNAIFAAASVPRTVTERLNAALNQTLKEPELQKRYADVGTSTYEPMSLEQAAARYRAEFPAWRTALKAIGAMK